MSERLASFTVLYEMMIQRDDAFFPAFVLNDGDEDFHFQEVMSGGWARDKDAAFVALYCSFGNRQVVLKALPTTCTHDDAAFVVKASAGMRDTMVPAHVIRFGKLESGRESLCTDNYTLVVMPHAGHAILGAHGPMEALHVVAEVASLCSRLLRDGFVYTDLKSANILRDADDRLVLCDYGGLAEIGGCQGTATFPPPWSPYGLNVPALEITLAYVLGALLASLADKSAGNKLKFVAHSEEPDFDEASQRIARQALDVMSASHDSVKRVLGVAWGHGATLERVRMSLAEALVGG